MAVDRGGGGGGGMARAPLTVSRVDCAAAAAAMAPVLERKRADTDGVSASLAERLAGAHCFAVHADGELLGHYALGVRDYEGGPEVIVIAAAGRMRGADLIASLLPTIEQQSQGAQCLTVHTKRRGMVAKLAAYGFRLDGFILHKRLA